MQLDATTTDDAKVMLLENIPQPDPVHRVRLSFATFEFEGVAASLSSTSATNGDAT